MDIQFVSSKLIRPFGTTQLRCIQPSEYLRRAGYNVEVGNIRDVSPIKNGLIIFHRTPTNRFTMAYGRLALSKGNLLIYDSDDLTLGQFKSNDFINLCHGVSVSTPYLEEKFRSLHESVFVVPNGLSDFFLTCSKEVVDYRKSKVKEYITVGYCSGSDTHQGNLQQVQRVLLELLSENVDVRVVISGKIRPSEEFHRFGERFVYHNFLPYYDYINLYKEIDINIAPLDVNSDFENGKSELKYLEAGVCGVPTIASPTATYANVIKHGLNGMLALDEKQWKSCILELISDASAREKIGLCARSHIISNYTGEKRAKDYQRLFEGLRKDCKPKGNYLNQYIYFVLSGFFRECRNLVRD